jgi:hypothetical protein
VCVFVCVCACVYVCALVVKKCAAPQRSTIVHQCQLQQRHPLRRCSTLSELVQFTATCIDLPLIQVKAGQVSDLPLLPVAFTARIMIKSRRCTTKSNAKRTIASSFITKSVTVAGLRMASRQRCSKKRIQRFSVASLVAASCRRSVSTASLGMCT